MSDAIEGIAALDRMWRSVPGTIVAPHYLQGFVRAEHLPAGTPTRTEMARGTPIARTVRAIMRDAVPIWIAPPICELLANTAKGLPDFVMQPRDLPCPTGLIWFAEPIQLEAPTPEDHEWTMREIGRLPALRAIGFHPWNGATATGQHVNGTGTIEGCAIAHYMQADDRSELTVDYLHGFVMEWGMTWRRLLEEMGGEITISMSLTVLTLATLAFMQQKVAHVARQQVRNKGAAARLRKATGQDTATVVTLRRAERPARPEPSGEHRHVNWSVQWMVGAGTFGHWRNQWYPSEGRHKPVFIDPYWKGDPDAPIKVGGKVIKVAR